MPGSYTIIDAHQGNYTLSDGRYTYPNIPGNTLLTGEQFLIGDQVHLKQDPQKTVYTIADRLAGNVYYLDSANESLTGVRGDQLELVD